MLKIPKERACDLPVETCWLLVIRLSICWFIWMNLFCVSACFSFLLLRAFWISCWKKSGLTVLMT